MSHRVSAAALATVCDDVACPADTELAYVLIPGIGGDEEVWRATALQLVAQNPQARVSIMCPPGFGNRPPTDCSILLADAARAALNGTWLHENELPVIYVGHSGGMMMALELAKADPNTVGIVSAMGILDAVSNIIHRPLPYALLHPFKTLLLIGLVAYLRPPLRKIMLSKPMLRRLQRPGSWAVGLQFGALIHRPGSLTAAQLELLSRHNRYGGGRELLRTNRHYNLAAHASEVNEAGWPLLVIFGRYDHFCSWTHASQFLHTLGGYKVSHRMLDCGHHGPVEAPGEVATAITEWAKALPDKAAPAVVDPRYL